MTVGMKLREAKWCTDCGEIYQGEACPYCGSTVYWWLSKMVRVMRRAPEMDSAPCVPPTTHRSRRALDAVAPSSTDKDGKDAPVVDLG